MIIFANLIWKETVSVTGYRAWMLGTKIKGHLADAS